MFGAKPIVLLKHLKIMEQIIMDKIAALPDNFQSEVADFVDFLIQKYHLEKGQNGLTDEQRKTIQNRYEKLNQNPESGLDWYEAKAKLMQKYV
jgi:Protein of unknown function (DUF2281)